MTQWKTLVVEDERLTREHICELVVSDHELDLVGSCSAVREAIKTIATQKPDLLLLDIQLPDGLSFEILKELNEVPALIFITAYDRYAIRAFEERAIDYLLKPFGHGRFVEAIGRAKSQLLQTRVGLTLDVLRSLFSTIERHRTQGKIPKEESQNLIALRSPGKTTLHPVEKITRVETDHNKTRVFTASESFLTAESLSSLEERLARHGLVRVHRRSLVNLSAIAEIQPWFHGDLMLVLRDGSRVKLSRRYKSGLEARLGSKI